MKKSFDKNKFKRWRFAKLRFFLLTTDVNKKENQHMSNCLFTSALSEVMCHALSLLKFLFREIYNEIQ